MKLSEIYQTIAKYPKLCKDNPVIYGALHDYGIVSDKELLNVYERAKAYVGNLR